MLGDPGGGGRVVAVSERVVRNCHTASRSNQLMATYFIELNLEQHGLRLGYLCLLPRGQCYPVDSSISKN